MYKRKFWLDQEQPNLGYADVKLNIACMHPLACLHTLSLCVYCDLYVVVSLSVIPGLEKT